MRSSVSGPLYNAVRNARCGWQLQHARRILRAQGGVIAPATGRQVSTSSTDPAEPEPAGENTADQSISTPPAPPSVGPVLETPERGRRTPKNAVPVVETVDWPSELDVLWAPSENMESDAPDPDAIPPAHIFEEALDNLLITLHPQTQNRAVYPSPSGPAVEPTLALYCPIEGGDYVVDVTVKEMARRIGAEVLVLDAVQLAAGEWGAFGKAASMLRLPRNPLHFRAPTSSNAAEEEEDDDDGESANNMSFPAQQMMLTVMSPSSSRGSVVSAAKLPNPGNTKSKVFFDALVNMPSMEGAKSPAVPRIIYIRDFPTLSSTSSTWYRPLLNSVRQRRRGPIASPSSPVSNPTTIVFGICPSITPPEVISSASSPNASNLMSLLMSRARATAPITSASNQTYSQWDEEEMAVKAREDRLRRRLKKWERNDPSLLDDLPTLINQEESENASSNRDVVMLGGRSIPLPFLGPSLTRQNSESEGKTPFFRTSILVPSSRSVSDERDCRMERRREINELTARMAIGSVGGVLEPTAANSLLPSDESESGLELADEMDSKNDLDSAPVDVSEAEEDEESSELEQMWEEWGKRVELWMAVKQVADRAVGGIVADRVSGAQKQSLESTPVTWDAVSRAWAAQRSAADLRTSWLKEAIKLESQDESGNVEIPPVDEVVEALKRSSDLDTHEQRLLPCIIDPATMPTSFGQVHLPTSTIDSVRTIVSLPLLHPQAFQHGILKEHSITGCLLFGPPGTGKTLVVRALAKEAGCRMMSVSPSDVMDMFVGEGEKLVKAVFTLARKLSPCVVFLDEIDALLGARSSGRESGSSAAYRGVITEFMQEMDGLKTLKDSNVIVIGATNRPFDLDDAVLRRLPRRLLVDLPGEKEREAILNIMLRNEQLAPDVNVKELAKRTESFSGSDLKHLCVSAAVDAVKDHIQLPWLITKKVAVSEKVEEKPAEDAIQSENQESQSAQSEATTATDDSPRETSLGSTNRILYLRHFTKALKEISPSSSEAIGTLSALRKWNEEFGEGRRDRKRKQIWGKGRFGFSDPANFGEEDGRVLPSISVATEPSAS